ncbi:phosphoribosyl transferase [Candidatus Daviesbacteria bacterium]|nr:phosphoribosyl transferase [Candidatus Daviesbacteria bacterium]
MYFKNRTEAGRKLAGLLDNFKGADVVVYALPRGGVVIGAEITKAIHSPLDLIITRKIGHPYQPEYAIGAVAENGYLILNKEEVLNIDEKYLEEEAEKQKQEAKRRREVYLGGRKPIPCRGKIAILVDDGIATGLTIKAAIQELKLHYHPSRIIVAVPVTPREIADELELKEKVELIALEIPAQFIGSIGAYYQDFSPVEDTDVVRIIQEVKEHGNIPVPAI